MDLPEAWLLIWNMAFGFEESSFFNHRVSLGLTSSDRFGGFDAVLRALKRKRGRFSLNRVFLKV